MNKRKINLRFSNYHLTIHCSSFAEFDNERFYKYLIDLQYIRYFKFQREWEEGEEEHWQLHVEFKKQQYFSRLQQDFRYSHGEKVKDLTKSRSYCGKERSRISEIYEWGIPKRIKTNKKKNNDNEEDEELLKKLLLQIRGGVYNDISEIDIFFPILFKKYYSIIRTLWNELNPIDFFNNDVCQVIWVFGETGSGKTTWTNKYLKNNGWGIKDIEMINPSNMTYTDKITFDLSSEKKKVLIINEVDEEFPKHNNLIAFIDRSSFLNSGRYLIKNNFKLIIINSLYKPEEVFGYLGEKNSSQILRRIYNARCNSKVYEIQANKEQINDNVKRTAIEFQEWYKPKVIQHKRQFN